jgi:transcriptional regulator PpsR
VTQHPARPTDLSALSEFAPELAATFVRVAGDIALVLDAEGVIETVELGGDSFGPTMQQWIGRPWAETATLETRRKVQQLLQEAVSNGVSRRREVNHPSPAGVDIPVTWAAVRLGERGRVLAVGRDQRAIAAIQQRFVEAQQQLERDYWKGRQAEARYRALFHVATDAVFVVDAATLTVAEANRAAAQLLDVPLESLAGTPLSARIDPLSRPAVDELLAQARGSGTAAEVRARLVGRSLMVNLSATPIRSLDTMLLLVRAHAVDAHEFEPDSMRLASLVERLPDAVVITDSSGRVLMANPAYVSMVGERDESGLLGRSIADSLAWSTDFSAVVKTVRVGGIVPPFSALVHGSRGAQLAVECSAVLLPEGDQECIGFTIRRTDEAGAAVRNDLTGLVELLTVQMGALDLPAMIQEVAEQAERHFIRNAIDRSAGRVDAAARLLGISEARLRAGLRLESAGRATSSEDPPPRAR